MVTTQVVTQAEAERIIAENSNVSGEVTAESITSDNLVIRIVPLTGNDAADSEAVDEKIAAIQQIFDPEGSQAAIPSDTMLAYVAPGALEDYLPMHPAPPASILAAQCDQGQPVGTWRREDFNIKASGPETRIHGYVKYKRISCQWWRIREVKLWMINEPIKRVWFQNFQYTRYRASYDLIAKVEETCIEMFYGSPTSWNADWTIQARGRANVEVIDEHHIAGQFSCITGAGTTYNASKKKAWGFRLPGGTR